MSVRDYDRKKNRILGIIKDNPQGSSIKELSKKAELSRNTITKILAELKGERIINIREIGNVKLHYLK